MKVMSEVTEKNQRWITYFLGFIVSVIVVVILIMFKDILIPITIAILLTFLFHPLLELLKEKFKIPRPIGLVLIFILNFAVFYVLGLIFISSFGGFSAKMEFYGERLSQIARDILSPFNLTLRELQRFLDMIAFSKQQQLSPISVLPGRLEKVNSKFQWQFVKNFLDLSLILVVTL